MYKDDHPLNTIHRARTILSSLGILTVEFWVHSLPHYYTVQLKIVDTELYVMGKGRTAEYALASAYGELMERLQNQCLYFYFDFDEEAYGHQGYFFAPDEVYRTKEELLEDTATWAQSIFPSDLSREERSKIMDAWLELKNYNLSSQFVCIPYYDVVARDTVYIPLHISRELITTNGMSAGNTPHEALVQGISEIMERHCTKEIFLKKLVPPTIPEEYIRQFPVIEQMISQIVESGNFKVIVKDCSLGENFPVIAVILIDLNRNAYFIRYGAHPIPQIAMERTLTELMQGQDIHHLVEMSPYSFYDPFVSSHRNYYQIFRYGVGRYPNIFFTNEWSYEFKEYPDLSHLNNVEMLEYLVHFFTERGNTLLVRDVSFLGFPSYHVMIPGISELFDIGLPQLREIADFKQVGNILRNIHNVTLGELQQAVTYLKTRAESTLGNMTGLPLLLSSSFQDIHVDQFLVAALYRLGEYREAYNWMDNFVKRLVDTDPMVMSYYKCVRDYLGGLSDHLEPGVIEGILMTMYPGDVVHAVLADLHNPAEVFKQYPKLTCWECDGCPMRDGCAYDVVKGIYMRCKDRYATAPIDQIHLTSVMPFMKHEGGDTI